MSEKEGTLSVRYKDFEYTVSGDASFIDRHEPIALDLLSQLMNKEINFDRNDPIPNPATRDVKISGTLDLEKPSTTRKPIAQIPIEEKRDIQLFLEELPLHSEWQFTLAMAFYLSQYKLQPSFTAKSVRKQFSEARHTVPNNIHLSFHTCVKKDYLKEFGLAELQKTYEITETGIHYIRNLKKINSEQENAADLTNTTQNDRQRQLLDFTLEELHLDQNPNPSLLERMEDQALSVLYIYKTELDFSHLSAQDVHTILRDYFSYKYSLKAVQIALSRSRPKVKKIKYDGQMRYQLTTEGMEYIEDVMRKQLNSN
ncbi:hypothetical protein [Jeotgalibacillus marinus]|uniref:Uncharacterized protein n=1 Tax=Jeotgalibacillus marinus TaxID=86667 RepID=A0ABV3Q0M4_9BACL